MTVIVIVIFVAVVAFLLFIVVLQSKDIEQDGGVVVQL